MHRKGSEPIRKASNQNNGGVWLENVAVAVHGADLLLLSVGKLTNWVCVPL